jgi:regulator of nucleoside diphosphate kinase
MNAQTMSLGEKPKITVADTDHRRLVMLASASSSAPEEVIDELLSELDRADIVPHSTLPKNVIAIGSTATYTTASGKENRVTLVLPANADIGQGKISIFTPVGVALLGLAEGQTISWKTRNDQTERLTVLSVNREPEINGDDNDDGPSAA